jgi:hypothetical protein
MRPIDAYAQRVVIDNEWRKWLREVAEPAWGYFCECTQLDAPEVMPAGSTVAPKWGIGRPESRTCVRGEDWRWVTDPCSGARVRVPGAFDDSLLR